jgi:hypothetical protein
MAAGKGEEINESLTSLNDTVDNSFNAPDDSEDIYDWGGEALEVADARVNERARYNRETLEQIPLGQFATHKVPEPAVSDLIKKSRRDCIRDYKGLAMNQRGLADTEFWYLTEFFADEMELTLKQTQLKNKADTINPKKRKYFDTYLNALEGAGQQATVQAAQAYLRMTDDGFNHNRAFNYAMKAGNSALNEKAARIHHNFSHAGLKMDIMLEEFKDAVGLQRNATASDTQFNSVMSKGSIRDLF